MADKAAAGSLPRIGELIEQSTGVKFDTYAKAQKDLGLEAAMAAIASHPGYESPKGESMAQVVDGLLLQQANLRKNAVNADTPKVLAGEKLDGLANSSFLMVKPVDKAPAGMEDTLKTATKEMLDPSWLRAEGASNVTNYMRDILTTANGAKELTDKQRTTIEQGMKAGTIVADAIIGGKPLDEASQHAQIARLGKAMDAAIEANPAIKETTGYKANFATGRYTEAMNEGIENGLKVVNYQLGLASKRAKQAAAGLRDAGTTPAHESASNHVPAPAQNRSGPEKQ